MANKIKDDNISTCTKCNARLIAEELSDHQCFRIKDFWIIDGVIYIGDKNGIYYRFPTTKSQHPFKTPDESTEPDNPIERQ